MALAETCVVNSESCVSRVKAAKRASGSRGLVEDNLAQSGALRGQFSPEPGAHVFDSGIFQAFNLVEIGMVQLFQQWGHRLADLRVIVDPANLRIDLSLNRNLDLEAVPVHFLALVILRNVGQCLGRFECEIFGQACTHIYANSSITSQIQARSRCLSQFRDDNRMAKL